MNKIYEQHRKYRLEHLDLYNEASKKWYRNNKELAKERAKIYREKNKDKMSLSQKKWRKLNGKEYDKKWYTEHREQQLIRSKKYREENKDKVNNRRYIRLYGITLEDHHKILKEQNGLCAICGKKKRLVVDHNHKNGQSRGLLCFSCNSAIGQLGDNTNILEKAISYIEKHKEESVQQSI